MMAYRKPLDKADFWWFTNSSYLKGENGKYYVGYAITIFFGVIKAAPLPSAIVAQQAEFMFLLGKTANIYTDGR